MYFYILSVCGYIIPFCLTEYSVTVFQLAKNHDKSIVIRSMDKSQTKILAIVYGKHNVIFGIGTIESRIIFYSMW